MSRILEQIGLSVEQCICLPPKLRLKLLEFLLRWEFWEEAFPLASRLAEDDPNGLLYRSHLASCLAALGRPDEAAGIAGDLQEDHPGRPYTLLAEGDVCLARGDFAKALECYLKVVRQSPEGSAAPRRIAELYLQAGQHDKAYIYCRSILSSRESSKDRIPLVHPGVLRTLAAIHDHLGDTKLAGEIREELQKRLAEDIRKCSELVKSASKEQSKKEPRINRVSSQVKPAVFVDFPPVDKTPVVEVPPSREGAGKINIERALTEVFGIDRFRPAQKDAVSAALAGESQLVIMPTGGGKSLCYQLPAALLEDTTFVISPLIALMKDQVEGLPTDLKSRTTFINSTLSAAELSRRLNGIARGDYKLVYAAPERLRHAPFLHALKMSRVSLFVVDEAHCVSVWGHDFRPDYLFIAPALKLLGQPPMMAMTATATPGMRKEIEQRLGRKLSLVSAGVYRSNLKFEVKDAKTEEDKLRAIANICRETEGTGIIYVSTRKLTEKVAGVLQAVDIPAGYYHAGMDGEARDAAQNAFMSGKVRVIVATVAFGMGIDKSDVRFVIHHSLPRSLESYYQEAGRAGRDGLPSRCILFYRSRDKQRLIRLAEGERMEIEPVRQVYGAVKAQASGRSFAIVDDRAIRRETDLDETGLRVAISLLERVGLVRRHLDLPRQVTVELTATGEQADNTLKVLCGMLADERKRTLPALQLCGHLSLLPQELELKLLEWRDQEYIKFEAFQRGMLLELLKPSGSARPAMEHLLSEYEKHALGKITTAAQYAESPICRHGFITRYFGEKPVSNCSSCDNCLGDQSDPSTGGKEQLSEREMNDARTLVLRGIYKLPLDMSRKQIIRAFAGSPLSPINKYEWGFLGSLSHLTSKTIGKVIDGLLITGYLERSGRPLSPLLVLSKMGTRFVEEMEERE